MLAGGTTTLLGSTVSANIASVAANVGSAGVLRARASIIGPANVDAGTGDARPTRRSCRVYEAASAGFNFVSDPSCELEHPTDLTGGVPDLRPLEDDPKGFVLTPYDASPVRARIPSRHCALPLPDPLPAGQLLAGYVDWRSLLARDALGTRRDTGAACDIGAVQSPPPPSEPPPSSSGPPDSAAPVAARRLTAPTAAAAGTALSSGGDLRTLSRRVDALDRAARRADTLLRCTREVPVDQTGDLRHRWGFAYDERDGTGLDLRPALTRHAGRRRADLRFLDLSTAARCLSAAPDPRGTARSARAPDVQELRARVRRIERRVRRFDAWESCLSWIPVTEAGDRSQHLGYLRGPSPGSYDAAIDIDTSEWDDPDYELLAFVAGDRPFGPRECDTEPGEGFTGLDRRPASGRAATARAASRLETRVGSLEEDLDDLEEPVGDITRFDECLYTVCLLYTSDAADE